jgi:hypothetical protein
MPTLPSCLTRRVDEKGLLYAATLVDALDEVGITGQDRIVGISQGWKLTGAIKSAASLLTDHCDPAVKD